MSVTDQQVLNEIQYHTMETPNNGASMSTEIWTLSRVIGWLNDRATRFISETKATLEQGTLVTIQGQVRYTISTISGDMIDIFRVAWLDSAGVSHELQRSDAFPMDHLNTGWEDAPDLPVAYSVSTVPTLTMDIMPPPSDAGTLDILYTKTGNVLSNGGATVSMQDDFVPYIKWGVLADMLKADGPAHDMARSQYCEMRFQEGIELAHLMDAGG